MNDIMSPISINNGYVTHNIELNMMGKQTGRPSFSGKGISKKISFRASEELHELVNKYEKPAYFLRMAVVVLDELYQRESKKVDWDKIKSNNHLYGKKGSIVHKQEQLLTIIIDDIMGYKTQNSSWDKTQKKLDMVLPKKES